MNRSTALAAAALAAVLMAGCASPGYGPGYGSASPQPVAGQAYPAQGQPVYPGQAQQPYTVAYGTVESIQMVRVNDGGGIGLGTIAGGVVGGLLGSQVGGGTGKTVATVAGAVGGGAVGNRMEDRTRNVYQIGVRLDNGSFATITQDSAADLQVGSRVRIDNNNRVYRY